ncbi:MAG: hypothetical protein CFH01_00714 [Alphaproteobacteria bacterium MarineAlpha2_Bin1]|nr:MAG: hypothetical protein CFH01_00714 [Alphaproteobacteria bacterium MarineAlpha2_Bin1]|tara:strand:+ start:282 stop:446 length:165 start_codon:yes stop_codon:yes gene_type:complete
MLEKKKLNNERIVNTDEFFISKKIPIEIMEMITEIINHIKENDKNNRLGKINDQ